MLGLQPPSPSYQQPTPPAPVATGGATVNGLMSVRPLSAIQQDDARKAQEQKLYAQAGQPVLTGLVAHLRTLWSQARRAKEAIEKEMLSAVRARRGEYDPDVLSDIKKQGGSEIYMLLFATKARQMKALLTDVFIGTGSEKPWTMAPSPVPDIPDFEKNQIMAGVYQMAMQAEMAGLPMTVEEIRIKMIEMRDQVTNAVMELARKECERAEVEIEDILLEGGWQQALDDFLDDLTTFKTAFLKGPVLRNLPTLSWVADQNGTATAKVETKPKLVFERVDPFNMYPASWAKNCNDAPLFERHQLTRSALTSLKNVPGYSNEAIDKVLECHGRKGLHQWLQIDVDRASAEGRDQSTVSVYESDLIDALQFWGSVSGAMLIEWGLTKEEVPDPSKEYEVECWLIGEWVIKAMINPDPLLRRPYYSDGFSRIPGAFWHNSLYDMIKDCQNMCNSAARALANNLGIASGPQVYMLVDRLAQGEDATEMFPWKLWQMTSDPAGTNADPVKFFQPSSHAAELMGVFERFSNLADEYSGIPKYMAGLAGGEGGAGRTASGMSMMISNASKQIKQTTASIDLNVINPLLERTYHWLLQYNPDLGLKGDLNVKARGALSLVAKEAAQVRLNEFLQNTANPIDMQILGLEGRAELLRQSSKRLDINPDRVVPSVTVLRERMAMAQIQAANQVVANAQQQTQGKPGGQELQDGSPVTDAFEPKRQ